MMCEPGAVKEHGGCSRSMDISVLANIFVMRSIFVSAINVGSQNCNLNMLETGRFREGQ